MYVFDIRTEGLADINECIPASGDEAVQMMILLLLNPVMADARIELWPVAKVGLALNGVLIFADAPSVLETGHMPALDVCGGYINPTDLDACNGHEGMSENDLRAAMPVLAN